MGLYLVSAREFLSKQLSNSMEEIVVEGRSGYSKIYHYDYSTNEFGVIKSRGNISSYYKPKKRFEIWEKFIEEEGEKNEKKKI